MTIQKIKPFFSEAKICRIGGCLFMLIALLFLISCQSDSGGSDSPTSPPAEIVAPPYDTNTIDHAALAQEAAFGSDSLSASTNFSQKVEDKSEKASGLAGAAFVSPPKISNYGAVTLNYDVDVPKGRAGMQPAVGISYASTSGDGLLGIGWSLKAGLGAITRVTKNGPLFYDERDTFEYNGKREGVSEGVRLALLRSVKGSGLRCCVPVFFRDRETGSNQSNGR